MDYSTPASRLLCALCQKAATKYCSSCKDTPSLANSSTESRPYCSEKCQRKDWSTHKASCKLLQERRALYRLGDIIQQILYCFREKVFDRIVGKIDYEDGKMTIYDLEPKGSSTRLGYLREFPAKLFHTEEDKKTVLAALFCCDSVAWMHDAVTYALGEIASHIEERSFVHKDPQRRVINTTEVPLPGPDPEPDHVAARVTLKLSNEAYALDFTSAQYGYYEPVVPWSRYWAERGNKLVEAVHSGGRRTHHVKMLRNRSYGSMVSLISYELSASIVPTIVEWEYRNRLEISAMLELPMREFKIRKSNLVQFVDEALQESLGYMRNWAFASEESNGKANDAS